MCNGLHLTLLHSERPKLYTILAFLSTTGLKYSSGSPEAAASSNKLFFFQYSNMFSHLIRIQSSYKTYFNKILCFPVVGLVLYEKWVKPLKQGVVQSKVYTCLLPDRVGQHT